MDDQQIFAFLYLIGWLVSAWLGADAASEKGWNRWTSFFVVLVTGPIGWLWVLAIPMTVDEEAERQRAVTKYLEDRTLASTPPHRLAEKPAQWGV